MSSNMISPLISNLIILYKRLVYQYTYIPAFHISLGHFMPKTRVTRKFQITIPKEVREKVKVRPGEIVNIESLSEEEIIIRRFPKIEDPLRVLIGKKVSDRHIPVEEFEEKAETR